MPQKLRNICIIAHVDHGKTTLIDHLLSYSDTIDRHKLEEQEKVDRVMDTDALERQRGITIKAKNASIDYQGTKINIIDTPGHSDFSGEVERVLSMAEGSILLIDVVEGCLPGTRFVLEKAIKNNHKVIVCLNKIDRRDFVNQHENADDLVNQIFDLFIDLGADEDQCQFTTLYSCSKHGICHTDLDKALEMANAEVPEKAGDLTPLLDTIVETVPPPTVLAGDDGLLMQVNNIDYSEYLGEIAICKVRKGHLAKGAKLWHIKPILTDDEATDTPQAPAPAKSFTVSHILSFTGVDSNESTEIDAGDIAIVAGTENIEIGDTFSSDKAETPLPAIPLDKPTMKMVFKINDSPLSGQEGEAIQLRKLGIRLQQETMRNIALKLERSEDGDFYFLHGRGELQFSVLIEQMRREGLEFCVGRPQILFKNDEKTGAMMEPFEFVNVDVLEDYSSDISNLFLSRKANMQSFKTIPDRDNRVRIEFLIPSRCLIGMRSRFLTLSKGEGLMSYRGAGYMPYAGDYSHRTTGSIYADRAGKATEYALFTAQDRGKLFIQPGCKVYLGMIIGEHAKPSDLGINVTKEKKLTNIRTTSSDGLTILKKYTDMKIEDCLDFIRDDELIEVTPENIRMKKITIKT